MKVRDIITESMTFHPATLTTNSNGQQVIGFADQDEEDVECYICDGNGKDPYADEGEDLPCRRCNGKGYEKEMVGKGPEMNVANGNGYAIQQMLGLEPDEYGFIENKDLPGIMRKLMQLKNGDTSSHTRDSETTRGAMGKGDTDGNVTSIGRKGPTMIDMGRSQGQVSSYIDRLMDIVKYAQEKGHHVSWG